MIVSLVKWPLWLLLVLLEFRRWIHPRTIDALPFDISGPAVVHSWGFLLRLVSARVTWGGLWPIRIPRLSILSIAGSEYPWLALLQDKWFLLEVGAGVHGREYPRSSLNEITVDGGPWTYGVMSSDTVQLVSSHPGILIFVRGIWSLGL